MVDFIEEVDEQVRADRYRELFVTWGPWVLAIFGAVIIACLGYWGYETWRDRDIAKASLAYDKGISALEQNDDTGAFSAFEGVAKNGPGGYRSLALMQEGNLRLQAGKSDEAVALYDQAAKAAPDAVIGDMARLKAALALMDSAPYPQVKTRLSALIGPKKPYNLSAREALAMAKLMVGKTGEARADLSVLSLMEGASPEMQQRAKAVIDLIDSGQAGTAVALAKAAATMPPPGAANVPTAEDAPAPAAPPQAGAAPRTAQ